MAVKTIRIRETDGKVVELDRDVFTYKRASMGGPDDVRWQHVNPLGGAQPVFKVVFGSPSDPFAPGLEINVPPNGPSAQVPVKGLPGTYKYSVIRIADGEVMDDPNIIIKS